MTVKPKPKKKPQTRPSQNGKPRSPKSKGPHGQKYDWETWFSKKSFVLRRGTDFTCAPYVMAQMCRNNAPDYGVRISLSITDRGVSVKVLKKGKS